MIVITLTYALKNQNYRLGFEGEKGCSSMKSNRGCHEPACLLAHRLVDVLSVIVGYCELGNADVPPGTESAKRFEMIHGLATKMAKELQTHQCHLSELVQNAGERKRFVT